MSDAVVRLDRFPEERIAVVTLDRPPLNAIDEQVVTEFAAVTAELAAHSEIRAVLVRSALEGVFMAGADIHEFERIAAEGVERALLAQEVFTGFAELPQPTVAALNGHARVEREAFREVLGPEDAQAGVKAFLEGEKPTFSGS